MATTIHKNGFGNNKSFSVAGLILDLLFPRECFGCGKKGNYICEDCLAVIDINRCQYCLCAKPAKIIRTGKCQFCQRSKLDGIIAATSYEAPIVKNIIKKFKYEPFVKDLKEELAAVIGSHLELLDDRPDFSDFILTAIPLDKRRLRWRGYNQAEELAKALTGILGLVADFKMIVKTKNNLVQAELNRDARKNNVRGIFYCPRPREIRGKNILLADDVYTTGATMEEAAETLKKAGAKKVWGIVFARG